MPACPILSLLRATSAGLDLSILPALANRHGLITGATGTGKTVTLQLLAERFSSIGVPSFVADVKGDLSGLAAAGTPTPKLSARLETLGVPTPAFGAAPVVFWDVFGEQGHPVRATISDMGPLVLGRLLEPERNPARRADAGVQDRGRRRVAAAGRQGPARHAGVRRRKRQQVPHGLRQHLRRVHRRHPAWPDGPRRAGRRSVLRRAHAQHRGPDSDGWRRPRRRSTCLPPTRFCTRPRCTQVSCCGCCPSCSSAFRKWAIPQSRRWCSSSTKRTCCLTMRRPRSWRRSNRWSG